jgi:hypothetical protein
MNKQRIKKAFDTVDNQGIVEADVNLYESDIRSQAAIFLAKVATESKRQKRSKVKLLAILQS